MLKISDLKSSYDLKLVNEKALSWVVKNQKLLTEKFSKNFTKSPSSFIAQIKTKRGSVLIDDMGSILKKSDRSAYLTWTTLKRLGCPSSF